MSSAPPYRFVLAPMEGVTDAAMRGLLSELGPYSWCVTEFVRVSSTVIKAKHLRKRIPELSSGCATPNGTPIAVQLLGGDADRVSRTAGEAVIAGAKSIDLNFGCPAPTVNRHDGGATLLLHPGRLAQIVEATRRAVPREIPVSVKMRLGWSQPEDILQNAQVAAQAGASWITLHARTKAQGYRSPVDWSWIGQASRLVSCDIIANGDLWTARDIRACAEISGSQFLMLARGALADPLLAARASGLNQLPEISWGTLFRRYHELARPYTRSENYSLCRIKQWIKFVVMREPRHPLRELCTESSLDRLLSAADRTSVTIVGSNALLDPGQIPAAAS